MSDFRDQLRGELLAAAERRLGRRERRWQRRPSSPERSGTLGRVTGMVAAGALVLALVAIAGGLIIALKQDPSHERSSVSERRVAPRAPTPCNTLGTLPRAPQTTAPAPRLPGVLGVLRRPAAAIDRGAAARCAARAAIVGAPNAGAVYVNAVRAVGPGILGGEMFLVPVSHLSSPPRGRVSPAMRRVFSDPAVCIVTVGYPGLDSGANACTPLVSLQKTPQDTLSASDIPTVASEQTALREAGVPVTLRTGSIVAGVFADDVARIRVRYPGASPRTLTVHDNVVAFHSPHSASFTGRARVTLLDARGQTIRP